ncbi:MULTISPECIES: hypothetical protein [Streptomyces]|uniref:Uncharacterized protein n=1 Tax=Streptomyces venezuelae TaxID=54571 RepID=A0A5P2BQH9_STRVZ|nr:MULTISPECIES: hypothetical protein [Streptomyces]NDZ97873.1 hypothetical protein [Streptomyces sp. SID10116]MYY81391.1 hypothetical protein [Streptomyces sp. SID335]MYZ17122.1 hypothetical protein [Streptomyces sp. SID337]NDZ86406.1 hypothetical protein [Streptomyces sp. SID10115]NEB45435.1 hypothetical protein [Streptomyces sp. SID339]
MNGRVVLERFPAGGPRGSWPAEEFARNRRQEGQPAEVVMDLASDAFLVIVRVTEESEAMATAA